MCDCMDKIDAHLKAVEPPNNTMLVCNMLGPKRAVIATAKRDDKKRQKPAYMMATYCPFCGEQYPENTKSPLATRSQHVHA